MKFIRGLVFAALFVCYTFLMHHVNSTGQATSLAASLALVPILLLCIGLLANRKTRVLGFVCLLVLMGLAWWVWPYLMQYSGVIFWLQDLGMMLALLTMFARTLFAGRQPLCVHFAEMIHGGPLTQDHQRYAKNVTKAWVAFFAGMAITSTLLFFCGNLAVWSLFVNFFTWPLLALMFIAEFQVRRRILPNLPKGSVMDAVRAYRTEAAGKKS